VFTFPQPSGPYAIGTVTYHWVDQDRPELFSPEPGDHRELMVQIWYPAEDRRSSPRAPYMPDAAEVGPVLAGFLGMPASSLFGLKDVTTNAVSSAPVADHRATFPVIVLLVGIKGSYRQLHTFQVEELVSHGYVVAVPISRTPPPRSCSRTVGRWHMTSAGTLPGAGSSTTTSPTSPTTPPSFWISSPFSIRRTLRAS
jgi:predicted dienelactone hydrolase